MSAARPDETTTAIRPHEVISDTMMDFELSKLVKNLSAEPQQAGHTADTIVKYPDLRVVVITMRKGAQLKEHRTAGSISVQTISGHVTLRAAERTVDIPAGHLVTIAGDVPHSVEAVEDSAFLLTIAWREKAR